MEIQNKKKPQIADEEEKIKVDVTDLEKEADKVVEQCIRFDADDLAKKIVGFGQGISDTVLYDYQIEVAEAIVKSLILCDGDRITIHFPRQSGKTEIFKVVVPACCILLPKLYNIYTEELSAYKNGFYCGVFALSKETSITMFTRIRDVFRSTHTKTLLDADSEIDVQVRKTNPVELSNGSLVRAHSMLAKILVSFSYHLMIIDEAHEAHDTQRLTTDIQPMGTAYNGTFIMLGTAGERDCLFLQYIEANKEKYKNGGKKLHFQITWQQAAKVNPYYARNMEKIIEDLEEGRLPQSSFDMSYNLIWSTNDNKFMNAVRFQSILDHSRGIYKHGSLIKGEVVAGLDLGKMRDRTVLTVAELVPLEEDERFLRKVICWMELFDAKNPIPWPTQTRQLVDFIMQFQISRIAVDSTGIGESVRDSLDEMMEYTGTVIEKFVYSDKTKALAYKDLDDIIELGLLSIPADYGAQKSDEFKHFKRDLQSCVYVYKKNYKLVEVPESKSRTLHDDYADSLMLMNYAAQQELNYGNVEMDEDGMNWSTNYEY